MCTYKQPFIVGVSFDGSEVNIQNKKIFRNKYFCLRLTRPRRLRPALGFISTMSKWLARQHDVKLYHTTIILKSKIDIKLEECGLQGERKLAVNGNVSG